MYKVVGFSWICPVSYILPRHPTENSLRDDFCVFETCAVAEPRHISEAYFEYH